MVGIAPIAGLAVGAETMVMTGVNNRNLVAYLRSDVESDADIGTDDMTMRIDLKRPTAYPWYLRPFFWSQRRKYGAMLDSALAWARAPKLFLGVALLYGMIDRRSSPIEPALRSLVTVRVSQINWCRFCVDLNTATLLQRGASREKVEAIEQWRESELFDERERSVLDYAEAMTFSEREVEEVTMTRLKDYFDDDAIVELTGLIAFQNMSSKFNSALGVPAQGFCRIPEPTPSGTPSVGG